MRGRLNDSEPIRVNIENILINIMQLSKSGCYFPDDILNSFL